MHNLTLNMSNFVSSAGLGFSSSSSTSFSVSPISSSTVNETSTSTSPASSSSASAATTSTSPASSSSGTEHFAHSDVTHIISLSFVHQELKWSMQYWISTAWLDVLRLNQHLNINTKVQYRPLQFLGILIILILIVILILILMAIFLRQFCPRVKYTMRVNPTAACEAPTRPRATLGVGTARVRYVPTVVLLTSHRTNYA